jgi:hypothetical protein
MPSGIPENASNQLTRLCFMLKVFAVVQLGLGILSMFVDIFSGLMMMIGALILYVITCARNWCTPVFYIVITMTDAMKSVMLVGNYFANNSRIETQYGVLLFFTMIKFPFYTLTIYYSFLAYRELKALFLGVMYSGISEFAQIANPGVIRGGSNASSSNPSSSNNQVRNPSYQPFSGQGYQLN